MKPSVANRLQKRLREQDDKRKGRKEELKRKVKGLRRKYLSRSPPRENDSDSDSPSDSDSESDSDGRRRDDSLDVYRGKRRASPVRKRRERSDSDKSDSDKSDSERANEKREKRKREKSESGSERSGSEREKREKEKRKRRVRSESDSEKSDSEKSDSEREKREKEKRKRRERSESDSGKSEKSDSEREKRRKREKSDSDKPESPKRERREKRETERPREDTETKTARMEWDQIREEERMEEERLERDRRDRDRAAGIVPKPVEKAPFVISGGEEKGESFEVQEEPYEVHAENEVHENEKEAHENEKVKEREKEPERETVRETRDEPERETEKETRDEPEREHEREHEKEAEREHEREQEPEEPESVGKDFDESVLRSKFQYAYEDDRESVPSEQYNSKRIEQFILGKGFLILEYFLVHDLCSFILVQLPAIGETMMVYVNRQKYPINVSGSAYPKTDLERLKLEKNDGDTNDYENISMKGFDVAHSLDRISDTNGRQKSLAYYVQRQVQRMMYVTQHIDIKPCILLNGIFGFYDTYHIVRRPVSSEFYPVISLEILFSKTFLLEQNIPVFYGKLYSIMNQSNRNKMEYLLSSLRSLGERIERFKRDDAERDEKERDRGRLKAILTKLGQKQIGIEAERAKMRGEDRIAESYATRRLNDEWAQWEGKRVECNSLYGQVKREYDKDVFMNEVFFHELYYKIRDMEQMIEYLD